jgi:hypothetical protein
MGLVTPDPETRKGGPVGPPFPYIPRDAKLCTAYFLSESPPKRLLNAATRPPS